MHGAADCRNEATKALAIPARIGDALAPSRGARNAAHAHHATGPTGSAAFPATSFCPRWHLARTSPMGRRPVQHRLNRRGWVSQDLESPCRLRPQDFVFAEKSVEPDHALIAGEYPAGGRGTARDRHSAPSSGWHMSPARPGRRPPNPREIEPVTNGEREAEVPVAKLGRARQRRAGNVRGFRSDDVHGARQRRADAGPTAAPPSPLRHHGAS